MGQPCITNPFKCWLYWWLFHNGFWWCLEFQIYFNCWPLHIIFKPYLTPAKIMCWAGKWNATLWLDLIWDGSIPTWFTLIWFAPTLLFYITSLSSFFLPLLLFLLLLMVFDLWFLLVRITRSVRCTTLLPTNVKMLAIMVQFHLAAG